MFGQWLGVQQRLGYEANFWFGHQGYEYVDLGRFWQIFLLAGLFIWLFLMGRAMWPALRKTVRIVSFGDTSCTGYRKSLNWRGSVLAERSRLDPDQVVVCSVDV